MRHRNSVYITVAGHIIWIASGTGCLMKAPIGNVFVVDCKQANKMRLFGKNKHFVN